MVLVRFCLVVCGLFEMAELETILPNKMDGLLLKTRVGVSG